MSHQAFMRLRELGQDQALREMDPCVYWLAAATPREPSMNRCALIPRDDEKLVIDRRPCASPRKRYPAPHSTSLSAVACSNAMTWASVNTRPSWPIFSNAFNRFHVVSRSCCSQMHRTPAGEMVRACLRNSWPRWRASRRISRVGVR